MSDYRSPAPYVVSAWHGEGRSLYFVMARNIKDETEWDCLKTFDNELDAKNFISDLLNKFSTRQVSTFWKKKG